MGIAHAATAGGHRVAPLPVPALRAGHGARRRRATSWRSRSSPTTRPLLPRIRSALVARGHRRARRGRRRRGTCVSTASSGAPTSSCWPTDDLEASLTQAARAGRRLRDVHVVLVASTRRSSPDVRRVLEAGVDGVVLEADLEATLGLVVRAVCAGHVSLPRALRHGDRAAELLASRARDPRARRRRAVATRRSPAACISRASTVAGHLRNIFRRLGRALARRGREADPDRRRIAAPQRPRRRPPRADARGEPPACPDGEARVARARRGAP